MSLIKISTYSFIVTVVKILSGLVINKAVALYVGPSGLAVIGQFQNFLAMLTTAAQGAFTQGVIKYSAEYPLESQQFSELVGTTIRLTGVCSVVLGICIFFASDYLSITLLNSYEYQQVFQCLAFSLVIIACNNSLLAVVNGLQLYRYYFGINLVQSLIGLAFTSFLIFCFGLKGALYALVLNQTIVFVIALWWLRKHRLFQVIANVPKFSVDPVKKLVAFSLMGATSALMVPLSHIYIRQKIGVDLGWDMAGYWQAIWYISSVYLMVITTSLGTYYLPKLSGLKTVSEIKQEMKAAYKIIMPLALASALFIFFIKEAIINVLFTPSFAPMLDLFQWQLTGDVVKIGAWLIAYLMLAKARTMMYILTEITFTISLVLLVHCCVYSFGFQGVCIAYLINYLVYFFVMVGWLQWYFVKQNQIGMLQVAA